jgi:hypothetical protein
MKLVDGWQRAWRWYSVQMHALGTIVLGMLLLTPQMPTEIQAIVPMKLRAVLIGLWALGGLYARVHKQPGGSA